LFAQRASRHRECVNRARAVEKPSAGSVPSIINYFESMNRSSCKSCTNAARFTRIVVLEEQQ